MAPNNCEGLWIATDSDWAGDHSLDRTDTKSRTGYICYFNGMPVDWASAKQLAVATSSGDAEARALATGVQRGLQMQYIAEELGLETGAQLPLHVDATAAIGFARNNGGGSRMKHIDVREDWVQSIRDKKRIVIRKVDTKKNPADFFTKLFSQAEFDRVSAGLSCSITWDKGKQVAVKEVPRIGSTGE